MENRAEKSVLEYHTPARPAGVLTWEEADGNVRVIFGCRAVWVYVYAIVANFLIALMPIGLCATFVILTWPFRHKTGSSFSELLALLKEIQFNLVVFATGSALWFGLGMFELLKYRKWGRVSRVLTASSDGLFLSWLGIWRMREKRWAASEIEGVELRIEKGDILWRGTTGKMRVNLRGKRPIRLVLSSKDAELPGRIAERVAGVIGCPLRVK